MGYITKFKKERGKHPELNRFFHHFMDVPEIATSGKWDQTKTQVVELKEKESATPSLEKLQAGVSRTLKKKRSRTVPSLKSKVVSTKEPPASAKASQKSKLKKKKKGDDQGDVNLKGKKKKKESPYKGVTFYKRLGLWETNLWYKQQSSYGFSASALEAAWAYDKAVIQCGLDTSELNFPKHEYEKDIEEMKLICTSSDEEKNFETYKSFLRHVTKNSASVMVKGCDRTLKDPRGCFEVKFKTKALNKKGELKTEYIFGGFFQDQKEAIRRYNDIAVELGKLEAVLDDTSSFAFESEPEERPDNVASFLSSAKSAAGKKRSCKSSSKDGTVKAKKNGGKERYQRIGAEKDVLFPTPK